MTHMAGQNMLVWHLCHWPHILISVIGMWLIWQNASAIDVKSQKEIYTPDYRIYHNVTDVALHLRKIASRHRNFIHIDWTHHSRNGMPQLLTRIFNFSLPSSRTESFYHTDSSKARDAAKVRVLLSYGEHAREFFPVESFFYLLKNLTDGLTAAAGSYEERYSKMVLSQFDIYVIVMANPDGRKHVESSNNYCWRGTSTGVDINRNFDWQFANKGSSGDPKDEEFRGPYAFSEPECSVYVELTKKVKFDAFLSFHSGVRHIYMPFADTASKASRQVPSNFHAMHELSFQLSSATKHQFRYGKAYDLNFYTADGTAFDYMAGVRKIPFSLAIEMWENKQHRGLSCFDIFNPHSEQLMREVADFHPMYVELFDFLHQWKLKQPLPAPGLPNVVEVPTMTFGYVLLAGSVSVSLLLVYKRRQLLCATKRRIVHLRRLSSTFTMRGIFR